MKALLSSGRAGLVAGIVDQVATTMAAFMVTVGAARNGSVDHFGIFVLVQTIAVLAIGIARTTLGTSLLTVRARAVLRDEDCLPGALACASIIWAVALVVLVGLSIPEWAGASLCLAWGIAIGPVLWLDCVRYSLHARGRHMTAAGLAVGHLTAAFAVLALLELRHLASPESVVLAFGFTTLIVFSSAAAALRTSPFRMRTGARFIRAEHLVWRGYSANFVIDAATSAVLPVAVVATGGLATAAGVRACQTVVGLPLQIPHGLSVFVLGRGSQEFQARGSLPASWLRMWVVGHVALFGAAAAAVLLVREDLARALLGDTWEVTRPALPFMLLASLFAALTMWRDMEHKIHGTSGRMAKIRLVIVPIMLGATALGAGVAGTVGATFGIAVANLVFLVLAWRARPIPPFGAQEPTVAVGAPVPVADGVGVRSEVAMRPSAGVLTRDVLAWRERPPVRDAVPLRRDRTGEGRPDRAAVPAHMAPRARAVR